jgi:hypothetical protein
MVAVNRVLLAVQHPEQVVALEVEEALHLAQMARAELQALLGKAMLVAAEFILHLIMEVAVAEVLEPLVQVVQVLLAVMVVMDRLPLFLELL